MLNAEVKDEWCYVVMLNLLSKFAIAHFSLALSIAVSLAFDIHFSIQKSEFRILEDHR